MSDTNLLTPADKLTALIRSYAAAIRSNDTLLVQCATNNLNGYLAQVEITELEQAEATEDGTVGHA